MYNGMLRLPSEPPQECSINSFNNSLKTLQTNWGPLYLGSQITSLALLFNTQQASLGSEETDTQTEWQWEGLLEEVPAYTEGGLFGAPADAGGLFGTALVMEGENSLEQGLQGLAHSRFIPGNNVLSKRPLRLGLRRVLLP